MALSLPNHIRFLGLVPGLKAFYPIRKVFPPCPQRGRGTAATGIQRLDPRGTQDPPWAEAGGDPS